MNKEFVPYELAVKLKVLGFDEPCFGYFDCERDFQFIPNKQKFLVCEVTRPTFSQAFRWFREKFNIYTIILPSYADDKVVKDRFFYEIANGRKLNQELNYHNTYEEAELACLTKLIEIIESKSE
jgi:hypothetical protein